MPMLYGYGKLTLCEVGSPPTVTSVSFDDETRTDRAMRMAKKMIDGIIADSSAASTLQSAL